MTMLQALKVALRPITRHIPKDIRRVVTAPRFQPASPVRPLPSPQWPPLERRSALPVQNASGFTARFDGPENSDAILAAVRQHGIAVIDNFLTPAQASEAGAALRTRFTADNCVLVPAAHNSRMVMLSEPNLSAAKVNNPSLAITAQHPLIKRAGDDFYGDENWKNTQLYGLVYLDERKGDVHFHIDPSSCLKALVYLSDVQGDDDGCFYLDVGSHREGYYRMMTHYYEGIGKKPFEIPEQEIRFPGKVLGKAGTCILFNSIVIHRAGEVSPGHKRLSLTYMFDRPDVSDANINIPPWRYSYRHQSEERLYVQS